MSMDNHVAGVYGCSPGATLEVGTDVVEKRSIAHKVVRIHSLVIQFSNQDSSRMTVRLLPGAPGTIGGFQLRRSSDIVER